MRPLDPESAGWISALTGTAAERDGAVNLLHPLLVRMARAETRRRAVTLRVTGPELDDLAYQAAADALLAITAKAAQFRGDSRFTTWAYRFVIFEVSAKVGRHFWRSPGVPMDAWDWDQLPDPIGLEPALESEWRDLAAALRHAVERDLTPRQRQVFVAVTFSGVPLDAVAAQLGSTRNAVYKTMFEARGKLRTALAASGYLDGHVRQAA